MKEMIAGLNEVLVGFRLDAQCVDARRHRHFAFYDLHLGPKCQVNKIIRLGSEIALRIRSKSNPIIKTIPEQGIVRLQVVMDEPRPIFFQDLYKKNEKIKGVLPFLFGETDDGQAFWVDMAQNPHMLVAGSTGSGKSVFLHNLIANAVRTPHTTLMLADPKSVEFAPYRNSKLQNIGAIVTSYDGTLQMLESLVKEMESRYAVLLSLGLQSIEQMRSPFDKIVVIVDEVADLMLSDGRSHRFEEAIVKLAQKSRAAGIYLVLATQRPSVDVLTGLIKANFEARMSCRVSSRVDSNVILDTPGAEHLLGKGDAIFKNRLHNLVRLQIAMTTPEDVLNYG